MHHHACWLQQGGCRQAGCGVAHTDITPAPAATETLIAAENDSPLVLTPPALSDVSSPDTPPAEATQVSDVPTTDQETDATAPAPPPPLDPDVQRLLSEAQLRLRQGVLAGAEQLLAQAKELVPEHPAVLEMEGDIAREKGMNALAERLYRQAFQADRGNAGLEEKFATALLKTHQHEYRDLPDDSTWSDRIRRNPAASGVMSVLLPGLGQFHNGDFLKGAVLIVAWAMLLMFVYYGPIWYTMALMKSAHTASFFDAFWSRLFHGGNILLALLLVGVWIYSIIDAAYIAQHPD